MLKKLAVFYGETTEEIRGFLSFILHSWAYACFGLFWLFLFYGIAEVYPQQVFELVNSGSARAATFWACLLAIFIPHFGFNLLISNKEFSTRIWESLKLSYFLAVLTNMGLQQPYRADFQGLNLIEIVLTVMGMTMGMALALIVGRMFEVGFYAIVADDIKDKGEKRKRDSFVEDVSPFENVDGKAKMLFIEYETDDDYVQRLRTILADAERAEAKS